MDNLNKESESLSENSLKDLFVNSKNEIPIRLIKGIKENLYFILVAIIAIAFIGMCYVTLGQVNDLKTVLINSGLGIMCGCCIKTLLSVQGSANGEKSPIYVEQYAKYDRLVAENNPDSEYYDVYCEIENEDKIRTYQTQILSQVNLVYKKFKNGEYDNLHYWINTKGEKIFFTKKQISNLKKANNPKIIPITPQYLVGGARVSIDREKKEISSRQYTRHRAVALLLSAIIISCIFGMFAPKEVNTNTLAQAIWNAMQVVVFLILGVLEYIKSYNFKTQDCVFYIRRRCNYIIKFRNMMNNKDSVLWKRIEQYKRENEEREVISNGGKGDL